MYLSVSPTMAGENLQCSDYWKMHFKNFSSALHDLIITSHVKQLPINLPKKVCCPMQSFFKKKDPLYFRRVGRRGRRYYSLSSYISPFLKVSSLTFVIQTLTFQAKLPSHCVFKVIKYGYEIFQTVLSLNYKII